MIQDSKLDIQYSSQRGFTMIEILVVMAVVVFFGAIGIFMSGDMYRSSSFNSEVEALASSLQRARSQAVNNINESAHGVKILGGDYIIFEGPDYAGRTDEEVIGGNSSFIFTGPDELVFSQLSGKCPLCTGNIVISDGTKTTTIILNTEGRIDW